MNQTSSGFRRSGAYDMTAAPVILRRTIERLCFQHGIHTVEAEIAEIRKQFLIDESFPGPPRRPMAEPPPANPSERPPSKRSESMKRSWAIRHAISDYMKQHPDVSEEEATRIVKERDEQEPRTRVSAEEAENPKGRRGWDTRIENKMTEAQQKGEPIDREEAERRVIEDMRTRRQATKAARQAASQTDDHPEGKETQPAAA